MLITAGTLFVAAPAFAEDEPATPAFNVSGGVTLVSDYRFRGISQTNLKPAVQGTLSVSHESGLYVGTWASSIDNYVASGSNVEIDLYGGYKHTTPSGTTFDVGLLYYVYPDTPTVTSNFFEPYANVSHSWGPVTGKLGVNLAWSQKALSAGTGSKDGAYLYGELGGTVPGTGLTITGHLGHSFEKDYITFGAKYTDWSLTASYALGPASLSLGYVDTDTTQFSYPTGGGTDHDISRVGVVASIGVAF